MKLVYLLLEQKAIRADQYNVKNNLILSAKKAHEEWFMCIDMNF